MGFLNFVFELPKRLRTVRGPGPEGAAQKCAVPLLRANAFTARRRCPPPDAARINSVATLVTLPLKDSTAWRRQGSVYARAGRLPEAAGCFQKALDMGPDSDSAAASILNDLGTTFRLLNELSSAGRSFRHALAIYERLGRHSGVSLQCANLGDVCAALGDLDNAESWRRRGLEVDKARGYKAGMASHYSALGMMYLNRVDGGRNDLSLAEARTNGGRSPHAEDLAEDRAQNLFVAEGMFKKSLALHETLGSPAGVAASCGALGVIHGARGDLTQAEAMFRRSVALEEELGAVENLAADYGNLGNIHRARGRLQKAEEMHRKALGYALQAGNQQHQATAYHNLGAVRLARGDRIEARVCLGLALELFREIGLPAQAREAEARLREAEHPNRR